MARDTLDNSPIEGMDALIAWFEDGSKPRERWRIGTEHEKFGFHVSDLSPVAYEGPRGIEKLLRGMEGLLGWEPILDAGKIIGLVDPTGGGAISLEPGGQFELSGAPLETLHQTCAETNAHLAQVREIAGPLGIGFLGLGFSPAWTLAETPRMPKSRYAIMSGYMPKVGTLGLDMMYRTCTIQVNLDYGDEADMVRKMRVGLALQPVATALFANSPFTEGRPNGYESFRGQIWHDTDNNRAGGLPFAFEDGFGFERYIDWVLDVPMYFVKRGDRYIDVAGQSFRDFLKGRLPGLPGELPNMGDWTNHVSTVFPDVRLKRFLEMRGADGGPWRSIVALPAFWVGLLYDETAIDQAAEMVREWSAEEREALRQAVPRQGLDAPFRNRTVRDLARDAVEIARGGLARRARLNREGADETGFLAPLDEALEKGTPARRMLTAFDGAWNGDISRVFAEYAF
ncbi:glutamate--cysteine ligase [Pseudoxanthobacter soli DSM 19599]|uniref:Glutamate--cysteine ligase n=1 Tax=Pseudoxanthobacter soli DSM 19599 TaxID=1123029 RepID=A0A1M7ZH26_9HYPH|nr:glutamate--cysteine ligase [Pseudoxanthobacter soli]SHO64215.1 glutamate--cysteine ligase [Pseudoxanthobacter soli DSM 19599]